MRTTTQRSATVAVDATTAFRLLALGSVLALTGSYVWVLRDVALVVGDATSLLALVVAILAAATVLARAIRPRTAIGLAAAAGAGGFGYYLVTTDAGLGATVATARDLLADTAALATGLSVLRMVDAGTWALAFVPAPVFLSWYLALRRQYAASVVPGAVALFFLVLTGDASVAATAVGTVGALAAVALGDLERRGGTVAQLELVSLVVAAMLVLSMTVPLVPGSAGTNGPAIGGGDGVDTLEETSATAPDRSPIAGEVDLSPEVRFTVQSERPSYWRTGVYDRFTGDEWIRTGQEQAYDGELARPPGEYETVEQTVHVEAPAEIMPAAAHPIAVDGELASDTAVTTHGQIRPDGPLFAGDTYTVRSAIVDPPSDELQAAETAYPEPITETYLQTPGDVSPAFETYTEAVTADADTPYEKAVAVERYLRTSKEYSLEVEKPDGDVAEAFLFEMDDGYCVYFATTMVQMLRTADVPARYAVGYTSGQEIDDGEYVVRGTDAHAWVEVYFPDHGWVTFEPTPGGPREETHDAFVEQAREDGSASVDTDDSEDASIEEGDDEDPPEDAFDLGELELPDGDNESDADGAGDDRVDSNGEDEDGIDPGPDVSAPDDDGIAMPGLETTIVGLAALVGLVAGVRRTRIPSRLYRGYRLHWQRPGDEPGRDVERAYERLELLLEREYRPRRRSETVRDYLERLASAHGLDDRVVAVGRRYERVAYGDGVTREEATETIAAVDALVRDRTPILGRRRRDRNQNRDP
ncbi:transglutaminaseTgpA domain-containing protein [Natrialbaceae archaeon AArc-T1-2]|uniref:transglutaminaseTgpA domain-containing protein n=1 Tax=Natrialbaceae archaeon AArc-T1-2 TaxID=3053904 RepID=UPI00255AFDFB|nr:transglutaminaseTgpA domain-containing protein [Natrialbaceae archaeon AArc-T1-2]WIV68280.1 transglutaminaseTgpA domain-containing protein [Natrialbaceae archaeon AArc-T1-2]